MYIQSKFFKKSGIEKQKAALKCNERIARGDLFFVLLLRIRHEESVALFIELVGVLDDVAVIVRIADADEA